MKHTVSHEELFQEPEIPHKKQFICAVPWVEGETYEQALQRAVEKTARIMMHKGYLHYVNKTGAKI